MSTSVRERQRREDATERKVMTTEEWVRRALVLQGRV